MKNQHVFYIQVLDPGTEVEWTSGAQGSMTTKRGIVVQYVEAKRPIISKHQNWTDFAATIAFNFSVKLDGSSFSMIQRTSQRDRYLVVVPRTHKRTGEALPAKVYTPIASLVKPVEVKG